MGWWRGRITEALRTLITLKGLQWSQRFQRDQWFSGRAQIDALVYELYGLTGEEIGGVEDLDHDAAEIRLDTQKLVVVEYQKCKECIETNERNERLARFQRRW